ncbi:Sensor histidine kinase [Labilithrix luteola]|uniref:histidine kinase n=1 Tax=Labilithrix luteola TaxID=1391654 RepID=A0A0K1PKA0_9BACT|nr:ATP-binding protein [Labilithrix luteola]AKU93816.1 Sensor histidine kinase [Labilithrix luteola]
MQTGQGGVTGDIGELVEALANVVLNAIEATPPGGAVFVATYEGRDESQHWTVQDTGPGMPQTVLRRVGTPFFSNRVGGSGIGTALVREVIERRGGDYSIESKLGSGTFVSIRLPRATTKTKRDTASPESKENAA